MLLISNSKEGKQSVSMDELYKSSFNPFKLYYDFYEDAWIGYIPASFLINQPLDQNSMPIHIQIDKGENTSSTLISQVIDTFKQKGISHIETDFHKNNKILFDSLKRFGFSHTDSERLASRLHIDKIKLPKGYRNRETLEFQILAKGLDSRPSFLKLPHLFDLESQLIDFLVNNENISKNSLTSFFQYLKENPDKIVSQTILIKDTKIQGHAMVVRTRWNKNTAILSFLDMLDPNDFLLKDLLIAKSVNDCKIHKIDLLEVYIRDDVLLKEQNYERYGFEFKTVHHFELNQSDV
ncbi:MAG: hypothetical protein GPJ54_08405 [Candidatus Heimdallarchaeota archaeon]|nr:hypothetical protein [Candidatus Heimdallarchaeota archaeon]